MWGVCVAQLLERAPPCTETVSPLQQLVQLLPAALRCLSVLLSTPFLVMSLAVTSSTRAKEVPKNVLRKNKTSVNVYWDETAHIVGLVL